jgi:pimeloyl-ACP methyl ester carboxylesterase
VSATNRVCAYDRAGQGWSESAPEPHDAQAVAADLHALVREANEPGPYVLAGHSSGGIYAMTYAAQYPGDVVGVVLLDAPNPYGVTPTDTATTVPASAVGPLGIVPTLARMGALQVLPTAFWSSLPEPHAGQVRAWSTTARAVTNQLQELSQYPAAFSQAQALTTLEDTPLVVVTTSGNERAGGPRYAAQERFADLSTNSSLRIADTSHAGLLDDVHGAKRSTRAIQDVLRAVHDGDTVSDR